MYCMKCKSNLDSDEAFCHNCGHITNQMTGKYWNSELILQRLRNFTNYYKEYYHDSFIGDVPPLDSSMPDIINNLENGEEIIGMFTGVYNNHNSFFILTSKKIFAFEIVGFASNRTYFIKKSFGKTKLSFIPYVNDDVITNKGLLYTEVRYGSIRLPYITHQYAEALCREIKYCRDVVLK